MSEIVRAIDTLEHNPFDRPPLAAGLGELVIGHGCRGYVVPYRYADEVAIVFVLAIRRQKELG